MPAPITRTSATGAACPSASAALPAAARSRRAARSRARQPGARRAPGPRRRASAAGRWREEVLEAVWHQQPDPANIRRAVVDPHVQPVSVDEQRRAGPKGEVGTVDHRPAMTVEHMDYLVISIVSVLAHVTCGRDRLGSEAERRVHRHAAGGDQHLHEPVGRHGLPEARSLARLDHENLTFARLVARHVARVPLVPSALAGIVDKLWTAIVPHVNLHRAAANGGSWLGETTLRKPGRQAVVRQATGRRCWRWIASPKASVRSGH